MREKVESMLEETWEDQYRRMKRSYALVKSDASQKDTALDALYHFCYDVLQLPRTGSTHRIWSTSQPGARCCF